MLDFFQEFLDFLKTRKKFWVLPLMITMLLLGGLVLVGQKAAVAPFIYTLF